MTTRDMLVMLMLEGKFVFTSDQRGTGTIVSVSETEVTVLNGHFKFKVPHDQAWFKANKRQVTVQTTLELIEKLAALLDG